MDEDRVTVDGGWHGTFAVWLVVATLVGAGLRFYQLESASFWNEELYTIRSLTDLSGIHHTKVLGYVPTAVGLWLRGASPSAIPVGAPEVWRSMGVTEWWTRLPSCLIGILTVPLLAVASRRVLGTRAAVMLAILLAVSPWHIYWSQAARFYTQQYLFYNLCLLWYFSSTGVRSRGRYVAAMVMLLLAFLTQPPALVICAVFAVDWIVGRIRGEAVRLGFFGWVVGAMVLGICFTVWRGDYQRNPDQWTQFAGRLYLTPSKLVLGTTYMVHPVVVLFAVLSAIGVYSARRRLTLYLILAAVIPVVVFAVVSTRSYVALRYTFVTQFAWAALAAIGAAEFYTILRPRFHRMGALAPVGLLVTASMLMNYGYYTSGAGYHTRWSDAYAYVAERRRPGEAVLAKKPRMGRYYLQDPDVGLLPSTMEELQGFDRPAWLVVETEDAVRGRVQRWIDEVADWRMSFDVRVVEPYSCVRVYYYDPSGSRRSVTVGSSQGGGGSAMIGRSNRR